MTYILILHFSLFSMPLIPNVSYAFDFFVDSFPHVLVHTHITEILTGSHEYCAHFDEGALTLYVLKLHVVCAHFHAA